MGFLGRTFLRGQTTWDFALLRRDVKDRRYPTRGRECDEVVLAGVNAWMIDYSDTKPEHLITLVKSGQRVGPR
jgi:hypothetical protein